MPSHSRLLRRQYTGNLSLKTTDHCKNASFLAKFTPKTPVALPETTRYVNRQFLLELGNVLSSLECAEIIDNAEQYIFENMSDKYRFGKQRRSSRLLALDKPFAEQLWKNIKGVLSAQMDAFGVGTCPHGFDVTRGVWELHGLNDAIRINKYSGKKREYFGPHKDAQFCPNGDERSIFTLLVYLNDVYRGGETSFYYQKTNQSTKGQTIEEEIQLHGGLKEGYDCVRIVPKVGHAIISSQDILHESLPVMKGTKYILKTDVVVKRYSKQFGFAVNEREKKDYITCLNFFREAQQEELQGKFDIASDLYERALSIRYCYPQSEKGEESNSQNRMEREIFSILPPDVWYHVFEYTSDYDAQNLVYAYPELNHVKGRWEQHQRKIASSLSNEKYLPTIRYQKGIVTCFEFSDAEYFRDNMTTCCRVAAMYSFFLLGHKPQDDIYTVKYNPETQEVCIVALETLLTDVFYSRRCYGSFYNVRQVDPERQDPRKDFEASVDRNYMIMKHGVEFTGVELPDSFYLKSAVYLYSDQEYDESDAGVEDSGDDNDENKYCKDKSGDDNGVDAVNNGDRNECGADESHVVDVCDDCDDDHAGDSGGDVNQCAADERGCNDGNGNWNEYGAERNKYGADDDNNDDHVVDGDECGDRVSSNGEGAEDDRGGGNIGGVIVDGNKENGEQNGFTVDAARKQVDFCEETGQKNTERNYGMNHEQMEINESDNPREVTEEENSGITGNCQKIIKICAEDKSANRDEFETHLENRIVPKEKKLVNRRDPEVSNKNKNCKEIFNGFIPYYGEINEKFPVVGILRYLLMWKDISNFVPREVWWTYDQEFELLPETAEERVDDITAYFDSLVDIHDDCCVSVARVSRLNESLDFEDKDVCVCHFGPPEDETSEYVDKLCTTEFFNHLVFDFQTSQLSVKFMDANPGISTSDVVYQFYRDFIDSEMASLDCTGETVYCEVNIDALLSHNTSFNHASCQCVYPRLEVHEYYNLKDYPSIGSVDIIAKETSGKMLVWTIYSGIVAL